jgi:hypothetical protein
MRWLERSGPSVLRDAEAGLCAVFETWARAAIFISESPVPAASPQGERMDGDGLEVGF